MTDPRRILLFHTAFIGDIVLMLPLAQALRRRFPKAWIGVTVIPATAGVIANHPAFDEVIVYDKRGNDRGVKGAWALAANLRSRSFDTVIIPHRSLRSALVCLAARIPRRVGFDRSAGWFTLTDRVRDDRTVHEITRNLSLASPLGLTTADRELPSLYPSASDTAAVDALMREWPGGRSTGGDIVAVAPGSVWKTKRWPADRFAELVRQLVATRLPVVLLGGPGDAPLCEEIARAAGHPAVLNAAGRLSLLQSAELIRRCRLVVSNDSAPMHLAVAMRVPVIAIFGATVPAFGFSPAGPRDVVVETFGLSCRPCGIHGGDRCPVGTFECMLAIDPKTVLANIIAMLHDRGKVN